MRGKGEEKATGMAEKVWGRSKDKMEDGNKRISSHREGKMENLNKEDEEGIRRKKMRRKEVREEGKMEDQVRATSKPAVRGVKEASQGASKQCRRPGKKKGWKATENKVNKRGVEERASLSPRCPLVRVQAVGERQRLIIF